MVVQAFGVGDLVDIFALLDRPGRAQKNGQIGPAILQQCPANLDDDAKGQNQRDQQENAKPAPTR